MPTFAPPGVARLKGFSIAIEAGDWAFEMPTHMTIASVAINVVLEITLMTVSFFIEVIVLPP
jgi:hypothetical protein